MYVLTSKEMQEIDNYTINNIGISQDVLMEKAALCAVEEIISYKPAQVLCVCGNGNNGGDGIAVARILQMRGICATVYMCLNKTECKESIQKQVAVFEKIGGKVITTTDFSGFDLIVDALFGIGLNRTLSEPFVSLVKGMNDAKENLGTKIISLDIPSGIHADTGEIMGASVKADVTVTFAYPKRGHLLYPGKEYTGQLIVKDTGMYLEYSSLKDSAIGFSYFSLKECKLPVTPRTAHKGTQGRVLVIAGSKSMYGACYLASCAAFRMGCGLVEIYTDPSNLEALKNMIPEAILHGYDDEENWEQLSCLLERADCVVLGPGLSTEVKAQERVAFVMKNCSKTLIIDADAINCIAQNRDLLYNHVMMFENPVIMTPHPKELSGFLSKNIQEILNHYTDVLIETAHREQIIIVGKGAATIVTDGKQFYINTSGNEGMATAGSGDVLTGFIAGLIVRGESPFQAACKGVYLHGKSGDYMSDKVGRCSLMAHDLLNGISYINQIEGN